MLISDLLPETAGTSLGATDVKSVTSRSEHIREGTLFFLLPGVGFDSGKYLSFCASKHPAAIITECETNISFHIPIWKTDQIRQKYALAAAKYEKIDFSSLRIHGITGTNGKTSTAKILRYLLARGGDTVGFIGTGEISYGGIPLTDRFYSMTTPDPDLLYPSIAAMQKAGVKDIVMEVSSHASALGKTAPIRFYSMTFLGLSCEHLDFHRTMEDYYQAKKSLFTQAERAVVVTDHEYGKRLYGELKERFPREKLIAVGAWEPADFRIECPQEEGDRMPGGQVFCYRFDGVFSRVTLRHPARFQRYNAAAAMAAATLCGASAGELRRAMADFDFAENIPGRWETAALSPEVIIDYAHTPAALESLLAELKSRKKAEGKLILVFGCGGERDRTKRPEMAKIAEKYADYSFVTEDNSRSESPVTIIREIQKGFADRKKYEVIANRAHAVTEAILRAEDADTVAIVGKGAERYTVDSDGIREFDERKIIAEAMKTRAKGYNKKEKKENAQDD